MGEFCKIAPLSPFDNGHLLHRAPPQWKEGKEDV